MIFRLCLLFYAKGQISMIKSFSTIKLRKNQLFFFCDLCDDQRFLFQQQILRLFAWWVMTKANTSFFSNSKWLLFRYFIHFICFDVLRQEQVLWRSRKKYARASWLVIINDETPRRISRTTNVTEVRNSDLNPNATVNLWWNFQLVLSLKTKGE